MSLKWLLIVVVALASFVGAMFVTPTFEPMSFLMVWAIIGITAAGAYCAGRLAGRSTEDEGAGKE